MAKKKGMERGSEREDLPACLACGSTQLVRHSPSHPHHPGAWHCNGCGTCGVEVMDGPYVVGPVSEEPVAEAPSPAP